MVPFQMDAGKAGVPGAGAAGPGGAAEGVLASFFNSLLSKKGAQGSPTAGVGAATPAGGSPALANNAASAGKTAGGGGDDCKN